MKRVAAAVLFCSIIVCYGDEKASQAMQPHIYKFACERPAWPPEVAQPYPARGPIHPDLGRHSDYGVQPRAQDDFYIAFAPLSRYCQMGESVPQTGTDEEKLQAGAKTCADRSVEYMKQHRACPAGSRPISAKTQQEPRTPWAVHIAGDALWCYQLCEDIALKTR